VAGRIVRRTIAAPPGPCGCGLNKTRLHGPNYFGVFSRVLLRNALKTPEFSPI
jgi:hypothetical protein